MAFHHLSFVINDPVKVIGETIAALEAAGEERRRVYREVYIS